MTRLLSFFVRRIVAGVFTVIAMLTIAFVMFWAIPSEPTVFVYTNAGQHLTNYQIRLAHHYLGIDKPKIDQYFHDVGHVLRFDFGREWEGGGFGNRIDSTGKLAPGLPIAPELYSGLRVTLSLILGGAFFVLLFAVPLGTFAGSRIGSLSDRTISLVALIGVCMHPMVLGLILRSTFGHHLHWTPQSGYCPLIKPHLPHVPVGITFPAGTSFHLCGGIIDWASHLALPWLTFALLFLALYIRMIRASVADTLHEDYVRTARAKGASEFRVLRRHVLPNASLRILTMIGMEISTAIGVSIYLETAFGLPGLASQAVQALAGNSTLDLPLVLAVVMLITLFVVVGNLVVDLLYAFVDPRAGRGPVHRGTKSAAGGVI
ncbi:MAG TPA: ABC transporter permease [Gaiellaceae bacterium]|jgi:peptide/nickel transport system permease protein|nr:ABC transporter permease [Gaiellaceae bacterium]